MPADQKTISRNPSRAYIGLRVLKETSRTRF